MDPLTIFINLISKTQGRDKVLRFIQYATLNAKYEKKVLSSVYDQMRITRKVLRFLRTLEYTTKIRKQIPDLGKLFGDHKAFLLKIFGILQNVFTFLFFLSDHRVCLSELGVIDKSHRETHYPRSMKCYLLQNVFGVLRNILEIFIIMFEQKINDKSLADVNQMTKQVRSRLIDMIKCLLDIIVALFYLNGSVSSKKAGIIGVITSLIGIGQSTKLI